MTEEYEEVLKKVEELFDASSDTYEGFALMMLVTRVEEYENKYFKIGAINNEKTS